MKPKAVLFDVDGTIIPLEVVVKTFEQTCEHFGIRFLNTKEIMDTVLTSRKILDNAIGYKLTEILPSLIPEVLPFEKEFEKYFQENQIKNFKKYSKLLPYVKPSFEKIKKMRIKIGIVTTKREREAKAILKGYGLCYDIIVGSDDVKKRKPHPEPVLKACRKLGINPEDCMFVGDHPFDMQASKSAGCVAVGVLTGWGNEKNLKKAGADYTIKNLRGLINLIEKGE